MIGVEVTPEMIKEAVAESMAPVVRLQQLRSRISVNASEAAELMGMSEGTLKNMRSRREGPVFSKVGTKVLYRVKDLEKYLEATGQKTNVC